MSTQTPAPATAPGGDAVFEQIHEVMFLFRAHVKQALGADGGAGAAGMEMRVLGFFARRPGATQAQLVQHSGRDKGQVARLVKGVIERGLLQRDPQAGPRGGLVLTPSGLVLQQRLHGARTRLADEFADALSAQERVQLLGLLKRLQGALEG